MLQCYAVRALQEDAQLGMLHGLRRGQRDDVFLPRCRRDVQLLLDKLLVLVHGVLVNELYADSCCALRSFRPHREAVLLTLLDANAEVALVDQS